MSGLRGVLIPLDLNDFDRTAVSGFLDLLLHFRVAELALVLLAQL